MKKVTTKKRRARRKNRRNLRALRFFVVDFHSFRASRRGITKHSSTRRYFEIYDYVNDRSLSVRLLLGLEKLHQFGKDQLVGDELLDEIAEVSRVVNIARLERPSLLQPQDIFFGNPFDNEIPHPELRAFGDLHVQRNSSVDVVEDRLRKYLRLDAHQFLIDDVSRLQPRVDLQPVGHVARLQLYRGAERLSRYRPRARPHVLVPNVSDSRLSRDLDRDAVPARLIQLRRL